ncbi:MAG: ubiquinone/menaquinone biosynthesis methyltransferase [Candidatus Oleimicrobiaceae bacterium]
MTVSPEDEPTRPRSGGAGGAPPGLFRLVARRYDLLNRLISFDQDRRWRRKAAAACLSVQPHAVLDVGTGTADQLLALHKLLPTSTRLVGLDSEEEMLWRAKQKLAGAPNAHLFSLCRADALHLPFQDGVFGAVTMAFAIRNFGDRLQALGEARRVLTPDGLLVVLEASIPQRKLFRTLFTIYCRRLMPAIAGSLTGQRAAYRYLYDSILSFPPPPEFCLLLRQAGFRVGKVLSFGFGAASLFTASPQGG